MKIKKVVAVALCAGLALTALSACEKEGPAEKAGKTIDKAASDISEGTDKAVDTVKEQMEK